MPLLDDFDNNVSIAGPVPGDFKMNGAIYRLLIVDKNKMLDIE